MHLYKTTTPRGKPRHMPGHPPAPSSLLQIQPGDVITVTSPKNLNQELRAILREGIKRCFPGHKTIILTGGIHLTAIRPAPTTTAEQDEAHLRSLGLLTPP